MARAAADNGADTRAKLMAAAVAAFAEKGFHGTTTRDIAAAAGLSPAAVYVHFESKEALLYLTAKSGHERTLRITTDSQQGLERPSEQLAAWVAAFVDHHVREHTAARVVNYELRALDPGHWAEVLELRQKLDRQLVDIIERGAVVGEFATTDARMAATAINSLGIDVSRWYTPGGTRTPEEIAGFHARLALRIVEASACD